MYYEEVFRDLNEKGVRYLVVGGMAVVLHGIVRLTADLDILVDLKKENVLKLISAMENLGYKPRVPVPATDLADEKKRHDWITEKNMEVFTFIDPKTPLHLVDVLIKEPVNFEQVYERKVTIEAAGISIPVISIKDLMKLKQIPGREKDLNDFKSLENLIKLKNED